MKHLIITSLSVFAIFVAGSLTACSAKVEGGPPPAANPDPNKGLGDTTKELPAKINGRSSILKSFVYASASFETDKNKYWEVFMVDREVNTNCDELTGNMNAISFNIPKDKVLGAHQMNEQRGQSQGASFLTVEGVNFMINLVGAGEAVVKAVGADQTLQMQLKVGESATAANYVEGTVNVRYCGK